MTLRLAVAQCRPALGDTAANLALADGLLASLHGRADLVVLPEMFVTGYRVGGRLADLAEPPDGPAVHALSALARRYELVVVAGFPERDGGDVYNSACVVDSDGSLAGVYRKTHLFADEVRCFRSGTAIEPVNTSLGRLGVLICYDVEFPEVARTLALRGAELLIVPTANMAPYLPQQRTFARARAMENSLPLALANQVGDDSVHAFVGGSCVVSRDGDVLGEADGCAESTVVAEVVAGRAGVGVEVDYLRHRRPELYAGIPGGPTQRG